MPFVRSPYNYDVDAASVESALLCSDPTLTVQDARDESDINFIVKQFMKDPTAVSFVNGNPQYGDFTDVPADYQSALNSVIAANQAFAALPARLRSRFENDPGQFVDFCSNPANLPEMVNLGLATPKDVDLSTAPAAAFTGSQAAGAVGKSGAKSSAAPALSNGASEGGNGGE